MERADFVHELARIIEQSLGLVEGEQYAFDRQHALRDADAWELRNVWWRVWSLLSARAATVAGVRS